MAKLFDKWNIKKQQVQRENKLIIFYEREVWWCIVGTNIGVEIDGKNEFFLRPVVVLRKFNKDMMLVVPTSSKAKSGKYYLTSSCEDGTEYHLRLSQLRTISSKRLFSKMGTISQKDYKVLLEKVSDMVKGNL